MMAVVFVQVSFHHAHITRIENGEYFITDLGSEDGTWVGDRHLKPHEEMKLHPEDYLYFGGDHKKCKKECTFKVKLAIIPSRVSCRNTSAESMK